MMKRLEFLREDRTAHLALIVAIGFLAYINTFDAPFVFDDLDNIISNISIKNMAYIVFPSSVSDHLIYKDINNRYFAYASFALNYLAGGLNPLGYHLINIIIHILNGLAVYFLINLLFDTPFFQRSGRPEYARLAAFLSALLFIAHPVQTEAVVYISQRFTSLMTLFYLASIIFYLKFRLSVAAPRARLIFYYGLSIMFAIMAMKTKENAFTLPISIAMIEFLFFDGRIMDRVRLLLPMLLTMLIIPLSLYRLRITGSGFMESLSQIARSNTELSRLSYFYTELSVMTTYIRLIFLPYGLHLDYNYPISDSFFDTSTLLSFLLLAGIIILGYKLIKTSREKNPGLRFISLGIFWFFITLSVESSFIPIADLIFEHRVYLPSTLLFAGIVTGVFSFGEHLKADNLKFPAIPLIAVCLVLVVLTLNQNNKWRDEITLWTNTIEEEPMNMRAYTNLCAAYIAIDDNSKARRVCEKAIKLDPSYYGPYLNLGLMEEKAGIIDNAISYYEQTIAINPKIDTTYYRLGGLLAKKGRFNQAIEYINLGLMLNPDNAPGLFIASRIYSERGLDDKAIVYLQSAAKIRPESPLYHKELGLIYLKKNLFEEAHTEFVHAFELNPEDAEVAKLLEKMEQDQ